MAQTAQPDTTTTLDRPTDTVREPGDHDRMSHVVVPANAVTEAIINGTPVTALCGKTWVPDRDPKKYPACKTCQDVLADIVLRSRGYEPRS